MNKKLGITVTEAAYLKLLYRKQIEDGIKIRTKAIADFFGVRQATSTETLKNLDKRGLLNYKRYHGVEFTEKGILITKELLRSHRLLELLFVNFLDHDAKTACEEASKLDFYATKSLINSICSIFEHPESCPCNKAIFEDEQCHTIKVKKRRK